MANTCFKQLVKYLLILVSLANVSGGAQAQNQSKGISPQASSRDKKQIERFEKQVEELLAVLIIPGMSAVIVKNKKVLWAKGFGFADLEKRTPATPDTLYHIASLTKTFAATLIMGMVEREKLSLDEPVLKYSSDFKDDTVKIKHLLSHTSEGTPGEKYQYSGDRYAHLTAVIEKITGKPFRQIIVETFLDSLDMSGSVPGHDVMDKADYWSELLGRGNLNRYEIKLKLLAQPYRLYGGSELVRVPYPPRDIGAAAGLLSNVIDMAKYDVALDRHMFLKQETQDQAWTPFVSNSGKKLPHGLGWFVEDYHGLKLIWHFGHWGTGFSATYLKIPEQDLSLILLANSESLSAGFYRTGGIESNPFACSFLRLFLFEDVAGRTLPDPNWSKSANEFSAELARLKKQANGYAYHCEAISHASMLKRLEDSRANARRSIKIDLSIYDAYVGKYELNANRTFTVSKENNRLLIDIPRGYKSELLPETESKFFLKIGDMEIRFDKDEKGQALAIEIKTNGQTLRAKRIK